MISGMHYDLSADEVKAHFMARAEHHQKRAQWYGEQAKELKGSNYEARAHMSSTTALEEFERGEKRHLKEMRQFTFRSLHVIAGETYRFTERELDDLEFLE